MTLPAANAPAIIMIHGAMNDHSVWAHQARHFDGAGRHVPAIDLPGHGHDGAPALSTVEAMAEWLLAMLDAQNIGHVALAGHSMGSLIALEAAARAPGRVTHVALLGSTWPMKVSGALLKTALEDEPAAIDTVARWSHTPGHPAAGDSRALMQAVAARNPDGLLHNDLAACKAYANGAAAAAAIACPVLFLSGAHDMMTPPDGGQLLPALSRARMVSVDAGHQMMAEQPEAVTAALAAFLVSA
ncbi:alpha/beta fold hydrolase [Pseudoduganella plicata]|uniref:Alpha/beta hydrolase n=1 Tax=Pseudoduganella plicata TaxID=321984 RepID=A0A4P7BCD4_9BURK|nr:alpha/beta hydrolase [Pseudoduganella plicata]QBQ35115.1 alpha/beta hydrolase [Pseudoduganella plicata]GGZ10371.1 alpha/beta hydrolase [Pseudoduganella plicata]